VFDPLSFVHSLSPPGEPTVNDTLSVCHSRSAHSRPYFHITHPPAPVILVILYQIISVAVPVCEMISVQGVSAGSSAVEFSTRYICTFVPVVIERNIHLRLAARDRQNPRACGKPTLVVSLICYLRRRSSSSLGHPPARKPLSHNRSSIPSCKLPCRWVQEVKRYRCVLKAPCHTISDSHWLSGLVVVSLNSCWKGERSG